MPPSGRLSRTMPCTAQMVHKVLMVHTVLMLVHKVLRVSSLQASSLQASSLRASSLLCTTARNESLPFPRQTFPRLHSK